MFYVPFKNNYISREYHLNIMIYQEILPILDKEISLLYSLIFKIVKCGCVTNVDIATEVKTIRQILPG